MKKQTNYNGKEVYLGIDVHKKFYFVVAISKDREVLKRTRIAASPKSLLDHCQKFFGGSLLTTAYEAGFSGFELHRFLTEHGITNLVVNPASISVSSRDRVKTDKRDAEKIALQLAEGRLKSIHIPSIQREDYRLLTRQRETFLEHRQMVGTQLKSLLHYKGLGQYCTEKVSKKWLLHLCEQTFSFEVSTAIQNFADSWLHFDELIDNLDLALKKQAEEDHQLEKVYRSVPGVGPVIARILANELEDMSQFPSEDGLASFTGLTPCEYSSGDHRWQGSISHQGRSILRKVLVEAAWVASWRDESLGEKFAQLSPRIGSKKAIVALARILIIRIRACFNKRCLYNAKTEKIK